MARGEQWARGIAIARQVRQDYPDLPADLQRAVFRQRWKAIERDVAAMRRRPR